MNRLDRVEVYSSYAYAVEPRAFYFGEVKHLVEDIERAWKSPGRLHFYVRDERQSLFELIYEQADDRWYLRIIGDSCGVESPSTTR